VGERDGIVFSWFSLFSFERSGSGAEKLFSSSPSPHPPALLDETKKLSQRHQGLGAGENAKAALLRAGMGEMRDFACCFSDADGGSSGGASGSTVRADTFLEAAGISDVVASSYGGRNARVAREYALRVSSNRMPPGRKTVDALEAELLAGQSLQGDLLGLAAGMFWGLTTLVIRGSKLAQISTEKLLFYQVGVSAVLLPVLSLALGEVWVWPPSAFAWGSVLTQATLGGFVSFLIWMWMLGRYPATRMSSFVFFTPLFALLFGAWWLDETVTPGVLVAIGAVAAGMALMNRKAAG
jgi:hypothetical protein